MDVQDMHVMIIGAGIGGLAAGAMLAKRGAMVTVLEAQDYPGGCAATFSREGFRFDTGATIGCGFHPGGPMDELGKELDIAWPVKPEPVAWEYRDGDICLDLSAGRVEILQRFPKTKAFWEEQSALARLLWKLAKGGLSWPVKGPRDLGNLIRKGFAGLPASAILLKFASKSAYEWLASHDLHHDPEFVRFIDAQLLVSVQTTSQFANAVNAAIALDLPASGTFRVEGGMGAVASRLAGAIEKYDGVVLYRQKVIRIDSVRRQVIGLETSDGGAFATDFVLANMTPASLAGIEGSETALEPEKEGLHLWSAFTLYLGMEPELFRNLPARHVQIVSRNGKLTEGDSIFASISPDDEPGRAPEGLRAVTISTHAESKPWFEALNKGQSAYRELKDMYTQKLFDVLSEQFPGARDAVRSISAGTPVTWERYTGRQNGCVGGYPQTSLFRVRGPATRYANLYLVGDSIFPGQSLPGVVTGARRTVELLLQQAPRGIV
ncbi:MAG: FAD-dependent oxidoreductase [Chlorobium sp.]|nr:MAG: FAD-dependent oxidoreductase [Chlorobium sp.]